MRLLTHAKPSEDPSEQIVGHVLADENAECIGGGMEFERDEIGIRERGGIRQGEHHCTIE